MGNCNYYEINVMQIKFNIWICCKHQLAAPWIYASTNLQEEPTPKLFSDTHWMEAPTPWFVGSNPLSIRFVGSNPLSIRN